MKIDKDIINKYVLADNSFLVNCGSPLGNAPDPDLTPIRISLPKPPKLELIDGYGLPPEEQYFHRPKMPETLVLLENKIVRDLQEKFAKNINKRVNGQKILDAIWDEIIENKDHYKAEIEFIRKQWYHRIHGYWFYNNGKPTYICGWHYMYLSWWYMVSAKDKYPEYRDRDRKNFLFWYYIYNLKEPYRTFYGVVQPKNRRGGTTNMSLCAMYSEISMQLGKHGAILSQNSENAYKLFTMIVKAWEKMPFFFKPTWDGYYNQETTIKFSKPKNIVVGEDLKSKIDFAQSARGSEYDGDTIDFALMDESGKTSEADVTERWMMIKQTLSLGEGAAIRGFSIHPSTVEDMDTMGGLKYKHLIEDSKFYERNPISKQTKSGLAALYFPAYENLEEFTDKFGIPIIEKPTEQQIKDGFNREYGSRIYLQSNRDQYLRGGTPQDMKNYRRLVAKFPFTLEDCFKMSSGDVGFDIEKIDKRLAQLGRMKDPFIIGNFIEINGKVIFEENKEKGRFKVSRLLNPGEIDLKKKHYKFDVDPATGTVFEKEEWMPFYPGKYTAGGDPYQYKGDKSFLELTGSYQSDGGIAIFWERDIKLDPGDNIYDWESYRFVCTYRKKLSTSDEFCKDCLLACRYYGAMMFPEINIPKIWEYFEQKGYGGYLLYEYDEIAKKLKTKPGVYNLTDSKNDIFDLTRNYIEYRSHKECHIDLLEEWKKLKSFESLNKCDLAAAAGCAFLGSKSRHKEILEGMGDKEVDFTWWDSLANM